MARVETDRVAIYARVSTHDQQTLPMQLEAMRAYAERKGWQIALTVEEVGSGAKTRPRREELLRAARRKEIDIIVVCGSIAGDGRSSTSSPPCRS